MSKNRKSIKEAEIVGETPLASSQGKTIEELKEVVQTLQVQMNDEQALLAQDQKTVHSRQARILKMQGALEVMLQLIPKEEVDKMIAQETKDNRKNGVVSEG